MELLLNNSKEVFEQLYNYKANCASYAPGRINIIGEHTDYNLGLSLPAAINRWVVVVGAKRYDHVVRVHSLDFSENYEFNMLKSKLPEKSWQKYVYGAFMLFAETQKDFHGCDIVLTGNIPLGSGVSSSAGLTVALMNFFNGYADTKTDGLAIIQLAQQVEHQYMGVKCGLLDQFASQFSKAGNVMLLNFSNLQYTYFNANFGEYDWVLVDTKVKRELAASKYSERVQETQHAFTEIEKKYSDVKHFRDLKLEHLNAVSSPVEAKRLKHFITEDARVLRATQALQDEDLNTLGILLNASHESLRDDYEVSCEQLDFLQKLALEQKGCLGSRMMGGGFGGCTINLVHKEVIKNFSENLLNSYKEKFNIDAEIHQYTTVGGAGFLEF
ncbi:MAG: galactokinase [Cytophagales bacterium]